MGLTGAMYKSLRFDGEDSRNYGVYITGEAVFNSPERDVEMISIPGRNGEYARDLGRFTNIEVTYPAGLFGVDEADFADAIADFRNMLGSRVGYCRLEDDYNPGEYRMGVFKAGLEVTPANLKSGEFTITFNCKPQRFLTTGETATELQSGDTITNPTLFESKPQLQVWGYGDMDIDGQLVSLANALVGNTLIGNGATTTNYTPDYTMANVGDTVTVESANASLYMTLSGCLPSSSPLSTIDTITWAHGSGTATIYNPDAGHVQISLTITPDTCAYQTASTVFEVAIRATLRGYNPTKSGVYDFTISGNVDATGTFSRSRTATFVSGDNILYGSPLYGKWGVTYVDSTKSALGTPTYIDLDIGEAYYYSGVDVISANNAVTIPAVLPTLKPGSNTITFDNTITQFKVVPRWWKL